MDELNFTCPSLRMKIIPGWPYLQWEANDSYYSGHFKAILRALIVKRSWDSWVTALPATLSWCPRRPSRSDPGEQCTLSEFASQLRSPKLREPDSFITGCKQTCLKLPLMKHYLYCIGHQTKLFPALERDTDSLFQGSVLYKHPWKGSPEWKGSECLTHKTGRTVRCLWRIACQHLLCARHSSAVQLIETLQPSREVDLVIHLYRWWHWPWEGPFTSLSSTASKWQNWVGALPTQLLQSPSHHHATRQTI